MKATINFKGVEFEVGFDYQPEESAERGPYAQYPGCCESIDNIWMVEHKGTDFYDFFGENPRQLEDAIYAARETWVEYGYYDRYPKEK